MMDRSRSKLDLVGYLRKQLDDHQSQINTIKNSNLAIPDWIFIGDPGGPVLQNGALAQDSTEIAEGKPGFWKDSSGIVHFTGSITPGGGFTTVMATMPAGFRPRKEIRFAIPYGTSTGQGNIKFLSTGDISMQNVAASNKAYLNGISYRAEN